MDKMLAGSLYLAVVEAIMYRPTRAPVPFNGKGGRETHDGQNRKVLGISSPLTPQLAVVVKSVVAWDDPSPSLMSPFRVNEQMTKSE